jgi:uncharacterized membrane protein YozB (DUF420 family)
VLIPTIGLIIQIIVLGLLFYGYFLNKRLMFKQHGKIMALAVALHLIAIFSVMVPSFLLAVIQQYIVPHFFGIISILSLIHVPLGIIAASLGVWFVVAWRLQGLKGCFNRKRKMLLTMTIWLVSILLGMTLYTLFYRNLLMS